MEDVHFERRVPVTLPLSSSSPPPPLPPPRPGSARRLLEAAPSIPPRPSSTLTSRSRPVGPPAVSSISSGPGRGLITVENNEVVLNLSLSQQPLSTSISLESPRPGLERTQNLYVDAPLKKVIVNQPLNLPQAASKGGKRKAASNSASNNLRPNNSQPPAVMLKKGLSEESESDLIEDSIICRECGLCKCEACRTPRRLPEKWLCKENCLCSSETVLDTLSCMCCVKAVFYHCGKDSEEAASDLERPLECSGDKSCCLRWTFLTAITPLLPCLLCYPVLRGCVEAAEAVYQKCTNSGCKCSEAGPLKAASNNLAFVTTTQQPTRTSSPTDSEKRLLG